VVYSMVTLSEVSAIVGILRAFSIGVSVMLPP
jgi:hypothetical protein